MQSPYEFSQDYLHAERGYEILTKYKTHNRLTIINNIKKNVYITYTTLQTAELTSNEKATLYVSLIKHSFHRRNTIKLDKEVKELILPMIIDKKTWRYRFIVSDNPTLEQMNLIIDRIIKESDINNANNLLNNKHIQLPPDIKERLESMIILSKLTN